MPESAPTARRSTPSLSSCAVRDAPRFPREGNGRAQRPPPTPQNAGHPRARRCGDGHAHRSPRAQHLLTCSLSSRRSWAAKAQFRSLAEPWAATGISTGRLMIAVLGGLADAWSAMLSAPVPPKAAAGRKSAANTWANPRNLPTRRRPRPAGDAHSRRNPCGTSPQLRRRKKHDFEAYGIAQSFPRLSCTASFSRTRHHVRGGA